MSVFALPVQRHGDFVERYKVLLQLGQQGIVGFEKQGFGPSKQQTRDAVERLLSIFKVPNTPDRPDKPYQMGRTKVFFKPGWSRSITACW
jgi:myosin heavy subunit